MTTAIEIKRAWETANGAPDTDSKIDQCGRFLLALAASDVGSRSEVTRLSGLNPFAVNRLMRQARKSGLVADGCIQHSGWLEPKTGGIAFIADVLVLAGMLERVSA